MYTLEALINFIRFNPPYDDYWYEKDWEENLSYKIPNWIELITTESNWQRIEKAFPRAGYSELCKLFLKVNNFKFAIRWFFSPIGYHREAAKNWLKNIDNITIEAWSAFPEDIKIFIVHHFFSYAIKDKIEEIKNFFESIQHIKSERLEDLEIEKYINNTINIYLNNPTQSVDLFYLRFIIEKSKDEKYLKIFNELSLNLPLTKNLQKP
ncbi:MAG: hypothetical protein N3A01_07810 [Bacteroidales bacterium]|nr:hypothetical protein [Bacteroidales bacterium]